MRSSRPRKSVIWESSAFGPLPRTMNRVSGVASGSACIDQLIW
jgi:hypothetical protein